MRVRDAGEKRLKQMLTWMDAHIDQPATLGEIAASANVCPRECQRIFRRYLHASPIEYMQRRRIFTAAQLLATTDRAVTEIALDCGFAQPELFHQAVPEDGRRGTDGISKGAYIKGLVQPLLECRQKAILPPQGENSFFPQMKEWLNFLILLFRLLFLEREEEQTVAAGDLRMRERIHALSTQPQDGGHESARKAAGPDAYSCCRCFCAEAGKSPYIAKISYR